MDFQIEKVSKEKSEILKNLLEYYQYDFNVYYNEDLNENGRFEFIDIELYFENEHNQALFIKVKEKYAGFILISNNTKYSEEAICIEEFWIMPKYRKGMFAFKILKKVFDEINGKIEFIVLKRNERWLKTLKYWIEKNYKVLKECDIEKWDEQFTLFLVDTENKY